MPTAAPQSRRTRPAKPALSRAAVVAAALDLVHHEGLERVTMRRLAAALDTGPASLYVYVRDTNDLHAAVLDAVLDAADFDAAAAGGGAAGDWRDHLVAVLLAYTRVLFRHPGLARAALSTRPSGPRYLALLDRLLGLLAAGGVAPDRAAWAVDLLLQQATATAAEHGARPTADGEGEAPTDERAEFDRWRAAVLAAPAARYPHVAAAGAALFEGDGAERLAWGLRVVVNGALGTPRPGVLEGSR